MKKILVVGIILLMLGLGIPALAKTPSPVPQTAPGGPASSSEEYTVYIGTGINRMYGEGKFGLGWHTTVENTGDTNISGFMYDNETTLFGKSLGGGGGPFTLRPGGGSSSGSVTLLDFHPITRIYLTVVVEGTTFTKSGFEIGPFVLLVD